MRRRKAYRIICAFTRMPPRPRESFYPNGFWSSSSIFPRLLVCCLYPWAVTTFVHLGLRVTLKPTYLNSYAFFGVHQVRSPLKPPLQIVHSFRVNVHTQICIQPAKRPCFPYQSSTGHWVLVGICGSCAPCTTQTDRGCAWFEDVMHYLNIMCCYRIGRH